MGKIFLGRSGKLTRKHVKGAIELFEKDGFSVSRIAKIYGVARTTMERVLAGNGVLEISENSRIDEDMIQNVGILYTIGKMSLSDIGEKIGVSRWTVKKALHIGDVKTRAEQKKGLHKNGRRYWYNTIDKVNRNKIIKDYDNGMSAIDIATRYRLPRSRVYAFLHEENVPVKERGRYRKVAK